MRNSTNEPSCDKNTDKFKGFVHVYIIFFNFFIFIERGDMYSTKSYGRWVAVIFISHNGRINIKILHLDTNNYKYFSYKM